LGSTSSSYSSTIYTLVKLGQAAISLAILLMLIILLVLLTAAAFRWKTYITVLHRKIC
jgi:hypothetical protein